MGDASFKGMIQLMDPTDARKAFFNGVMTEALKERMRKRQKGCGVF